MGSQRVRHDSVVVSQDTFTFRSDSDSWQVPACGGHSVEGTRAALTFSGSHRVSGTCG